MVCRLPLYSLLGAKFTTDLSLGGKRRKFEILLTAILEFWMTTLRMINAVPAPYSRNYGMLGVPRINRS
jgi:hypothetical protein